MNPCRTVTEVDMHLATVRRFCVSGPTALRKGKLLHHILRRELSSESGQMSCLCDGESAC